MSNPVLSLLGLALRISLGGVLGRKDILALYAPVLGVLHKGGLAGGRLLPAQGQLSGGLIQLDGRLHGRIGAFDDPAGVIGTIR